MKPNKTLIALTISLFSLQSALAREVERDSAKTDTVIVLKKVTKATVTTAAGVKSIEIKGLNGSPEYSYAYKVEAGEADMDSVTTLFDKFAFRLPFLGDKTPAPALKDGTERRTKFSTKWLTDIYAGFTLPLQSPHIDHSWEIGVTNLLAGHISPGWSKASSFSIGVGFYYRRVNVRDGYYLSADNRGSLTMCHRPDGARSVKSNLKWMGIQVPLLWHWKAGEFKTSLGPVLLLNTYAKAGSSYKIDDIKHSAGYKNLHQRPLGVEFMASASFAGIGAYVRYSPTRLFSPSQGPRITMLSVGFIAGLGNL